MHPTRDETLLLRALVLSDQRGAEAWKQFGQAQGDLTELFRTDRGELRRLSPLLARSLKTNGADVDTRLWTVLRTASMREGLRAKIYQDVLREVVSTLRARAIPFAVFRGAAIGALAYGDVSARHSHDIDVLVHASDVARAEAALLTAGYLREQARELEAGQTPVASVLHSTSLPVRLHSTLFELNCYELDTAFLLNSVRGADLEGVTAPVLAPEVTLLQLLAHASYSTTRFTLQWVPDAFRVAALVTNWDAFAQLVHDAQLSLAVYAQVAYLENEIGNVLPASALEQLRTAALKSTHPERDFALYGARVGSRVGARSLFGAVHSPVERLQLAKWLAFPSAEYLRWAGESLRVEGRENTRAMPAQSHGRNRLLLRRFSRMLRARKTPPR